jgi:phage shock protein PspC (stress-responsive transcriptional regulator)
MKRTFTDKQARELGKKVGIDFEKVNIDEFRKGLTVELEHGAHDPETNVTNDDLELTAKITWAHLKELPDYYTRLIEMEAEAEGRSNTNMKRLRLSNDKKLMGVCGGIAEYFEIDPTLVRLAWIVLTILTGIFPGLIGYFIAAIVMPNSDE